MSATSMLDALGAPWLCTWEGKEYTLAPPDRQDIKAQFEGWLEDNAWRDYERAKKKISGECWAEYSNGFRQQMAGKAFSWGGVCWMSAITSEPGQKRLTFLMLQAYDATATEELALKFFQANYQRVLAEIQKGMGQDPNATAPPT
jgi:hypothetical protein